MSQFIAESPVTPDSWKMYDSNKISAVKGSETRAGNDGPSPRNRIRRSMTACNTCRKLKTRCDLEPHSHACRRCLSLRIECELPEAAERNYNHAFTWPDRTVLLSPRIEERLSSLERSMQELTETIHQMMAVSNHPSVPIPRASKLPRVLGLEDCSSEENCHLSPYIPRPVHLIGELQLEVFREKGVTPPETHELGDIVTTGLIHSDLAQKLIELFVDHFGPWISIYSLSDLPQGLRQNHPLLFNTACLLASRYVPQISLPVIHVIYNRVRHFSASILWDAPPLKYESLQALALLCLWTATVQTDIPMDSWLLSGISINHAIVAFGFLNGLPTDPIVSDDLRKFRLWNAFCLTRLHFAIGNARPFSLQHKCLEYCSRILEHSAARLEDARVVAEIQLYSITLGVQNNILCIQNHEVEFEEITQWEKEWTHLFTDEPRSTLDLGLWFCHLLLHRTTLQLPANSEFHLAEVIKNSRLIISKFIQVQPHLAVDFIDHIFFVVTYAAITLCEFDILCPLVDQVQVFLISISPNGEHIAYQFGRIISEVRRRFMDALPQHSDDVKSMHFTNGYCRAEPELIQFAPTSAANAMPEGYATLEQLLACIGSSRTVATSTYSGIPCTNVMTPAITQRYL